MLYVLNGSIAIVLFVLIFAFGVKLSKESASKMKRGAILPAVVGLCTAVFSFLFLSFLEGRVLSYPNPQAAYQANHFGEIDAVTEGACSTLVVSQDGGANSAITILPKDGNTWKIGTGLETKIVSSIVAGSPKVLVSLYRYVNSSDYYLVANTIDLEGQEIEITDSENTSFVSWEQKASIGTFYYCSAYLNGLDQDYALLVNGESVTFAEEKG